MGRKEIKYGCQQDGIFYLLPDRSGQVVTVFARPYNTMYKNRIL